VNVVLAIALLCLAGCTSDSAPSRHATPTTGPSVRSIAGPGVAADGLLVGRNENTELVEIDERTIAVVDGAAAGTSGQWHLTVYVGDPAGELTPRRLPGPPLVFVDAYRDGHALVVTGTECPAFVPEEVEDASYSDICGDRAGRRVAYRLTITDGTWHLLSADVPGLQGFQVTGNGAWGLVRSWNDNSASYAYHRLDSRTGALTPIAALDGRSFSVACSVGDKLILHPARPDVAPTIVGSDRTVARATPPEPPLPLERIPQGCLPGFGAIYRSEDQATLAGLTLGAGKELVWRTIPAPPPAPSRPRSLLITGGDSLTAWGAVGGFRWDGAAWQKLEGSDGVAFPQRAVVVGNRLVSLTGGDNQRVAVA
jgi:hypothetical protein